MDQLGDNNPVLYFPRHEHPLEYDLILVHVFKFCSVNTLKQCRMVNKSWWVASLDTWRATAVLRIFWQDWITESNKTGIKFGRFMDYLNPNRLTFFEYYILGLRHDVAYLQLHQRPFKNYAVVYWSFLASPLQERRLAHAALWQYCRSHMQHLTFDNSFLRYDENMWIFLNSFPNLTSLSIKNGYIEPPLEGSPHRGYTGTIQQIRHNQVWLAGMTQCLRIRVLRIRSNIACGYAARILKRFPNLEELVISLRQPPLRFGITRSWIIPVRNIFRTIRVETDRGEDRFRALKKLDIMDVWENAVRDFNSNMNYEEFSSCKFTLSHLSLDLGENSTQRAIKAILDKNANTLQVLKGFRAPTHPPFIHSFPFGVNLPQLRELYLWGYIVQNMDFLLFMPNLKVLSINLACHDMEYKLNSLLRKRYLLTWREDIVANTMEMIEHREVDREPNSHNLESLYIDHNFPPSSWIRLRRWLPNLGKLSTILNPDTMTLVAKLWPNLSQLEMLFGSDIGDEYRMITALGILYQLSHFKLETYCCKSTLSDLCVYEGFLPLPYLEWVEICVSKGFTIRAERALKEKLGVHRAKIARNYGQHREMCCDRAEYNCRCVPLDPQREEPRTTRSGTIRNPDRI